MRSSISSSKAQTGAKGVSALTLVLSAALVAILLLFAVDRGLRALGAEPTYPNTRELWSLVRERVQHDTDPRSIVLLGASRIQTGVALNLVAQRTPAQVHQLAIAGSSPLLVFEDIAINTRFRGVVIMSVLAPWFVPELQIDESFGNHLAYYHHNWNWARALDTRLKLATSQLFVFTHPHYGLRNMVENLLRKGVPFEKPYHNKTDITREETMNFDHTDPARLRQARLRTEQGWYHGKSMPAPEDWMAYVQRVEELADIIRARGGHVIYVQMPSGGDLHRFEESFAPRQTYWNHMQALVTTPMLHFEDIEGIENLSIPDDSHIDKADKARFTAAFLDALAPLGAFRP